MNLKREGAAIRALLEKADGVELSAEVAMEKARMDADELRWEAARRCTEAFEASGLTRKAFAIGIGIDGRNVSRMIRVWQEWEGVDDPHPRFYDAAEMLVDATVAERAISRGRSVSGQAADERRAAALLKGDDTAKAIMRNPIVRESTRRAIVAAEAEEARQKLLATAEPVALPKPTSGFNWLEARGTLSQARIAITAVIRMVKEHGPLVPEDVEALQEGLADIRVCMEWLETVMQTGDIDDELVRLLSEER